MHCPSDSRPLDPSEMQVLRLLRIQSPVTLQYHQPCVMLVLRHRLLCMRRRIWLCEVNIDHHSQTRVRVIGLRNMWPYSGGDEQLVVFPWKPSPASVPMHASDMLHRGTSNQAPAEEGCSPLQQTCQGRLPHPSGQQAGLVISPDSLFATAVHHTCVKGNSQTCIDLLPLSVPAQSIHEPHSIPMCMLYGGNKYAEATCRLSAPEVLWQQEHTWTHLQAALRARHSWQSCSYHPGDALHRTWEYAYATICTEQQ